MRVAFLHLNLSGGPEERNLALLHKAISLAAEQGANWIVTPEMAVQGYFFAQQETAVSIPPVQPDQSLQPIRQLAAKHQLTVFLGCAEQDAETGKYYNSCLVIGPEGSVLGSHRKTRSHGGAEAWVTVGDTLEPVSCPGMKAGIMVCADSWFVDKALALKDKGAEVLMVLAAWPPGECGPGDCWERCSQATGLSVWVCNQTGNQEALDFSQAQSVVVADGKTQFSYSGLQQAVLLFDWDRGGEGAVSTQFTVLAVS